MPGPAGCRRRPPQQPHRQHAPRRRPPDTWRARKSSTVPPHWSSRRRTASAPPTSRSSRSASRSLVSASHAGAPGRDAVVGGPGPARTRAGRAGRAARGRRRGDRAGPAAVPRRAGCRPRPPGPASHLLRRSCQHSRFAREAPDPPHHPVGHDAERGSDAEHDAPCGESYAATAAGRSDSSPSTSQGDATATRAPLTVHACRAPSSPRVRGPRAGTSTGCAGARRGPAADVAGDPQRLDHPVSHRVGQLVLEHIQRRPEPCRRAVVRLERREGRTQAGGPATTSTTASGSARPARTAEVRSSTASGHADASSRAGDRAGTVRGQRRPGGHGRERRGDHRGPAHTGQHGERTKAAAGTPGEQDRRGRPYQPGLVEELTQRSPNRSRGEAHPGRARPPPTRPAAARAPARGPAERPSGAVPVQQFHEVEPGAANRSGCGGNPPARSSSTTALTRTPARSRPTPPSTRPGTATISRTRRRPSGSVPACTTRSTLAATVGTTKSLVTFGPASSGSVHSLPMASRAEFGVHAAHPRDPGVEGQQQVEALLLAHLADDEAAGSHPQRLLDQPAQPDLALALEVRLPGLHRDRRRAGAAAARRPPRT